MTSGALNFQANRITANKGLDQTRAPFVRLWDDFVGDTLNTDLWVATQTGAGTAWAVSSTAGDPVAAHGGWISATTEAIDAAANELGSMAATTVGNFRADRARNDSLLVFEASLSLPVITTIIVNAGFTDDETEGAALAMSLSGTTWTTTATDAALWVFDTNATTDVFNGQTVDTDVDGTHVAGIAPVAATATVLRIEIDNTGQAYFYQDGVNRGTVTAGVTETVPLIPYVAVGSTTTTAVSLEADYVLAACPR